MADYDFSPFLSPDPVLADLWDKLQNGEITQSQYNKVGGDRAAQLAKKSGIGSYGLGSQGYVVPNWAYSEASGPEYADLLAAQEELKRQLAGKQQLTPQADKNVFAAQYYGPQGQIGWVKDPETGQLVDPYEYGNKQTIKSLTDPNYKNPIVERFDAGGNKLTPQQLAATKTGKSFAAAGWDIGFGPGMIGPGIKAEPIERETETTVSQPSSFVNNRPQQQAAPNPTPPTPTPPPPPPPPVKTAPIDTILFDDSSTPIEVMTDLIFEDIGGQEIISIVRNDTVSGQNIIYQPIKNLSLINRQYNPNNVLALQGTSDKYFDNFIIKLSNKIPNKGNGPNGENIYINEDTADIVLDLVNLEQDEQAEFQFRIDGTIYEAEL